MIAPELLCPVPAHFRSARSASDRLPVGEIRTHAGAGATTAHDAQRTVRRCQADGIAKLGQTQFGWLGVDFRSCFAAIRSAVPKPSVKRS
jgi:hypothetical protein